MKNFYIGIAGGVLGALIIWSVQATTANPHPKVASVDLAGIMDETIKGYISNNNPEMAKKAAEAYGQRLDSVLAEMAAEYQVAIVIKPVVVAGATDLTLELKRRLDSVVAIPNP